MIINTLSGLVGIALFTQLFKSFLEAVGCKPTSAMHDPLIWFFAFFAGIGGYIVHQWIIGPISPVLAWQAGGQGVLAALSAVGTYHLATHAYFDSPPVS